MNAYIRLMLDFCGEHGITADVEVIPMQRVGEAYERLLRSDVKYRFSIDMASLRSTGARRRTRRDVVSGAARGGSAPPAPAPPR